METNWKLDPDAPKDCLIVDDDPAVIETITMYCENLGIFRNIVPAEDGQVAATKMRNQKFSLILIDVNMPKKDGIALLKDFTAICNNNHLDNVVIISGELDKNKLQNAIASGVKNFVVKPFDENTFREKIKPALPLIK